MKNIISKLWKFLKNMLSKKGEKFSYSSGYWPTKIRDRIVSLLPEEGTLLEVGCGEGIFLAAANKARPKLEIFGIDLNESLLTEAKERLSGIKMELKLGDGFCLPYEDASFDVVVCANVLYNLPDLASAKRMVGELRRVIKPGGKALFDIRNKRSLFFKIQYSFTGILDPDIKVPLNTYYAEEFAKMFKSAEYNYIGFPSGKYSPVIILQARNKDM